MKEIKLLPHNEEAYNKVKQSWDVYNKTAVIQPTGTGKSYIIAKVVEENLDKEILILSPSTLINNQLADIIGEELDNVNFMTYNLLNSRYKSTGRLTTMKYSVFTVKEIELKPDIIILDEFHRCGAKEWGESVAKLLDVNNTSKVLGTSATPIRYLDNERDMSDELFDGHVANKMDLSEAIVLGILPMPLYVTALYTLEGEIEKTLDKINKSKNSEEEKKELRDKLTIARNNLDRGYGIPVILKKYINFDDGKLIVFCKNNEHQKQMIKVVKGWFTAINKKVVNYAIYSGKSNLLNEREIEDFKNDTNKGIKLLFTIDMFNEGLHLDNIDGVILLRPTESPIIFHQQIGRAIDAGSDTSPLILDLVANVDNIQCGNFKFELEETISKLYNKYGKKLADLDLDFFIRDETIDITKTLIKFESRLLDNFDYMFNLLCEYKKEYGDCNVPLRYEINGDKLGQWVSSNRIRKKKGLITKEQEEKLIEQGIVWDILEQSWENNYELLKQYTEEYGHCNVNRMDGNYKGVNLASWVVLQRENYKKAKLEKNKVDKLNKLGITWSLKKPWEERFEAYKEYVESTNTFIISKKNKELNTWVKNQRKAYKENKLDNEKISKLNSIGFPWEISPSELKLDVWEKSFEAYKNYVDEYGTHIIKGIRELSNIATWASAQRKQYREGKLIKYKIDKLNLIDFPWEIEK